MFCLHDAVRLTRRFLKIILNPASFWNQIDGTGLPSSRIQFVRLQYWILACIIPFLHISAISNK